MDQLYLTTHFVMSWAGLPSLRMPPPKSGLGDIHCPLLLFTTVKKLLCPQEERLTKAYERSSAHVTVLGLCL